MHLVTLVPEFSLLLVFATPESEVVARFQPISQVLVDGESDSLAGRDSHDSGGDALVESVEAFLPSEIVSIMPHSGAERNRRLT